MTSEYLEMIELEEEEDLLEDHVWIVYRARTDFAGTQREVPIVGWSLEVD